jgi:hypothetical protein
MGSFNYVLKLINCCKRYVGSEMWPVLPLHTANNAPWHAFDQYVSHFLLLFLAEKEVTSNLNCSSKDRGKSFV